MKNLDKQRFANYGRYDLTVNRTFYRNLAVTTGAFILAITVLGFLIRWITKSMTDPMELQILGPDAYAGIDGTVTMIALFAGAMSLIFVGCFNHPLRNKQSRISVLTLPATNLEKFLWHTLLTIVGGFVLIMACIVVADAVNFLFSLAIGIPMSHIHSITAKFCENMFFINVGGASGRDNEFIQQLFSGTTGAYFWSLLTVYSVWVTTTFVFGNAVKYRYNIIFTIIAHVALQFVLSTIFIVGAMILAAHKPDINPSQEAAETALKVIYWIVMTVLAGTTVLMWRSSWMRYKNAQITTNLNK